MDFGTKIFLLLVLFVFSLSFYFLPTIKAVKLNHPDVMSIFLLNLLLGWCLVGWAVALVWAYKKTRREEAVSLHEEEATRKCPYCAEFVRPEAIKCRHCQSELIPINTS